MKKTHFYFFWNFCIVISTASVFLFSGCATNNFPVRRPVFEQPPAAYSRAKAQEYYIRARDFERRGLLKIAEREYENALQFDPDSKVLKKQVIKMYVASGKYTQALLLAKGGKKNDALTRDEKRMVSTIYLKMNEIEKAAWMLESIKKKSPEEAYSLAWIYESLREKEKALTYYLYYFHEQPKEFQLGLKIIRMMLQLEQYERADSFLVVLEEKNGKHADLFMLQGLVAIIKEDTSKGLALYDSALAIDSLHEETLRSKAQIYIERSDFQTAISCYEVLADNYSYGAIYGRALALLYYHNKQYLKAEKLLQKIILNAMNDAELHYFLGLIYAATDRSALAQIEFEKSIALKPEYDDAWKELCSLYLKEKLFDKATEITKRYTEANSDHSSAWRLKGYVASIQKKYERAILSYRRAIAIDSMDAYSWFELGSAYERNKNIDSAEIAFKQVLYLQPDDPATLNYLGYMWVEKGIKLDSATAYLQKALKKDPRNGAFLDSYAWLMYQKGLFDSALIYIERAILLLDADPVIFSHHGDILYKNGVLDRAVDAYKRSIELHSEEEAILRQKIVDLEILQQHE